MVKGAKTKVVLYLAVLITVITIAYIIAITFVACNVAKLATKKFCILIMAPLPLLSILFIEVIDLLHRDKDEEAKKRGIV